METGIKRMSGGCEKRLAFGIILYYNERVNKIENSSGQGEIPIAQNRVK